MDSFVNRKKASGIILSPANLSTSIESEWFLAAGHTIASRLTSRSFCLFKVIASNINYRSGSVSLSLVLSAGLYSLLFPSLLSRIMLVTHRAIMVYTSTYFARTVSTRAAPTFPPVT